MALSDLMQARGVTKQVTDIEVTEDTVREYLNDLRRLVSFWRVYPDKFVDYLCSLNPHNTFKFYFYQRVYLRACARYKYIFATFPRAYSKSFLAVMCLMIRCVLYPGEKVFVVSGGKKKGVKVESHLTFNENIFEKIDTEDKAYWLGFLYADGCIHNGNNYDYRIELGLKEEDEGHLEKFKAFIGKDNKISKREKTKSVRYNFRSKKVWQDLINLGCTPAKSLTLQFPTKDQVPDDLLIPFLRGYFDGDGSFWFEGKQFGLNILSSHDFLEGLKTRFPLFKSTSIVPIHYERPDKGQRIQTGNHQIVNTFLYLIYNDANIYLDRKYQKYQKYIATMQ